MDALAGTFGPDRMDIVIEPAIGDGFTDLVGGLVRAFAETGAAIADKQDVFDVGQVFYCHMDVNAGLAMQENNPHSCFYPESKPSTIKRNV